MTICPFKSSEGFPNKVICTTKSCPLWFEEMRMCSHKAIAFLLFDIHQIIIAFGMVQGIIDPKENEQQKQDKQDEEEGS